MTLCLEEVRQMAVPLRSGCTNLS